MADNEKTRKVFCIYPVGIAGEANVIRVEGTKYFWPSVPDVRCVKVFDGIDTVAMFNLDNIIGIAEEMTLPTPDVVWKVDKILV